MCIRSASMLRIVASTTGLLIPIALQGCADGGGHRHTPWSPDSTTVVESDGSASSHATPQGDACILPPDTEFCVEPQRECEDGGAADVILDEDGHVVDVVCFPSHVDAVEPVRAGGAGVVPQTANNTALVLEEATYDGDLTVHGNNFFLWGDHPSEASIDGDLTLSGNNAIVRGVTVEENVQVTLNNATLVHCVIRGDLVLDMNNARISGCTIYGNVSVRGNNTRLFGNRIQGELENGGANTACEDNRAFVDSDDDGAIDAGELGEPIGC